MGKYYTYAYLRKDNTPYYIGKGCGDRIDDCMHALKLPPKNKRVYLEENLTEEEAYQHEIAMIAFYGRKDIGTGILRNLTDGGDSPPSWLGKNHTEESRKKMSRKKMGNTNRLGHRLPPERLKPKKEYIPVTNNKAKKVGVERTEAQKIAAEKHSQRMKLYYANKRKQA
ncbi:hypothetical protein HOQ61_gp141 [Synechococcus phage ACG-2014f_Syn7803C7]|uniref:Nuclease associated modular domain-containing protein n=2 Tax=Atlauavirus TaxID=2733092 RepID=A0A0E3HYI1_9CAUD|nr:hypothetical protein HOQ61_gp141 [Synechococcus phage ACG-2014f_Syn7803C7]AIX20032.1 hypothetical protein Syn7803C7_141 [Synechococcus phage ACG-2014f_Syn7803C7]AIX30623.1 hypothetical protein Syn7803US37_146 [Synechococcus phage ACG-2014f]AIX41503.1 hypothetical protein Syn7803C12_141 [Synechococcus phage ACG-2014f]